MSESTGKRSYVSSDRFPILSAEVADHHEVYKKLGLTSALIEKQLASPEYEAITSIDLGSLSKKQQKEVAQAEKITGFGQSIGDVFETLLSDFDRLPTQKEFSEYGTAIIKSWWSENKQEMPWSETIEKAVYNRQLRSYSSHLVELHTLLTLTELFPEWNIYCSNSIDLLMGVDLVIETESKRLYIHVFKNSKWGFRSFHKKEQRGGRRNAENKFIKFKRNFSGDKCLQYDWSASQCSESTMFINNNPLFKKEYLETQLTMFNKFKQFGEELTDFKKLDYLEGFLSEMG